MQRTWRQRLVDWKHSASTGGLPLLGRDLREQAARPRTYVVRVAYTALIALMVFWNAREIFEFFGEGLTAMDLGRGREIFDQLILWQLAGVVIVTPIISAGAIAEEKERDTLAVLLTTQLGPRLIIREKFCSRMFIVAGLIAMSMPLLGFAYSLGGVSQFQLTGSIVLLVVAAAQSASMTICLSSWCSSTAAALTLTLLLGIPLLSPGIAAIAASAVSTSVEGVWVVVAVIFGSLSWVFLRLAESALIARAAVQARNPILEALRAIDRFFHDLNDSLARGKLIVNDQVPLPDDEPIAWRHRHRKSLGTVRYLVRVLLVLELPVLSVCLLGYEMTLGGLARMQPFTIALSGLWIASVALVTTTVTGLLGAERTHQTLDVVLATPLPGREFLRQSLRGIERLLIVIAIPFATVLLFRFSAEFSSSGIIRLLASVTAVAVLFPVLCWLVLLISLRIPSQLRATVLTTLLLAAWIVLPLTFLDRFDNSWQSQAASLLSPSLLLRQIESGQTSLPHTLGIAIVYSLLIWKLRRECLANADTWLNRS
ncbi:MAG: hypothetical protein ACYTGL_23925 [Planctomycetota bacterium]|jgi:hypothetical protein